MIYVREANFNDLEPEWRLVSSIPSSENGFVNAYSHISRENFDKALYEMAEQAAGIDIPEGFVPQTTLFIWSDMQIIGQARVRHYLNDNLKNGSGHIAIWIAPQYRGKGIGTAALREVLNYAEDMIPEEEFYLCAEKDNEASIKMMLKNGGRKVGENSRYAFIRIAKSGFPLIPNIRPLETSEYPILNDFLYEAIFIPDGVEPPPREIISRPELRLYTEGFGSGSADFCLAAELNGKIVGAVWARIMSDYGHIDDETPSLAISLYKPYRGKGIGTLLMKGMLELLAGRGYRRVSLAVQKANYAVRLYKKVGFVTVSENDEEFIMAAELAQEKG